VGDSDTYLVVVGQFYKMLHAAYVAYLYDGDCLSPGGPGPEETRLPLYRTTTTTREPWRPADEETVLLRS